MQNIINAILSFVILFGGNYFSPKYIIFNDTKTIIITSIVYILLDMLFLVFIPIFMKVILSHSAKALITVSVTVTILTIAWIPIKLILLNCYMPGFNINGIIPFILLTGALCIFRIKEK